MKYPILARGNEMSEIQITKKEARQFILLKQGLLGDYRFKGK